MNQRGGISTTVQVPGLAAFTALAISCIMGRAPSVFAENHDSQFAAFQILLIRQICIGCEQHVKPSFFSRSQQVTFA